MKKYTLHLSQEEARLMKQALRELSYQYMRSSDTGLMEEANIIDDVLQKVYDQEDE